jgi:hypothetical protein
MTRCDDEEDGHLPPLGPRTHSHKLRLGGSTLVASIALLLTLLLAPPAIAAPTLNESGPAGNAHIELLPYGGNPRILALRYTLTNTQGAFAGHLILTPVGLNSKATERDFIGNSVSGIVMYNYIPGEQVSVGVHVSFQTPNQRQYNDLNPFVVSYPR